MDISSPGISRTSLAERLDGLLKQYATQLAAVLAVVVGVTGVMMFFRLYKGEVESMHEWLGLGFVAAVALHVLRHRRPFARMAGQLPMQVLLAATVMVVTAFLMFSPPKQGNPFKQVSEAAMRAPVRDLAPVLGIPVEVVLRRLDEAGAGAAAPDASIETLAATSGVDRTKLLQAALGKRGRAR